MIITAADAETLREISAKWDKFFEQDLSSLKGNNDLVTQLAASTVLRLSARLSAMSTP